MAPHICAGLADVGSSESSYAATALCAAGHTAVCGDRQGRGWSEPFRRCRRLDRCLRVVFLHRTGSVCGAGGGVRSDVDRDAPRLRAQAAAGRRRKPPRTQRGPGAREPVCERRSGGAGNVRGAGTGMAGQHGGIVRGRSGHGVQRVWRSLERQRVPDYRPAQGPGRYRRRDYRCRNAGGSCSRRFGRHGRGVAGSSDVADRSYRRSCRISRRDRR